MTSAFADAAITAAGARARLSRSHLEGLCAGHFPDDPIVPGAYVAGLMAELGGLVAATWAARPVLARVERCTFLAPVRPADELVLVASPPERDDGTTVVAVEMRDRERCLARGRFHFA